MFRLEIPDEDDLDDGNRIECKSCGRKFVEESYPKHAKICKKVFASKRKTFDMKKQRIIDSEHASLLKYKEIEDKKMSKKGGNINQINQQMTKKQKWKKQSEEFRAILKNNRTTDDFPSK